MMENERQVLELHEEWTYRPKRFTRIKRWAKRRKHWRDPENFLCDLTQEMFLEAEKFTDDLMKDDTAKTLGASVVHLECVAILAHILTRGLQYIMNTTPAQLEKLHVAIYDKSGSVYLRPGLLSIFESFLMTRYATYDACEFFKPYDLDPSSAPEGAILKIGDMFFKHANGVGIDDDESLVGKTFTFRFQAGLGIAAHFTAQWNALEKMKDLGYPQ